MVLDVGCGPGHDGAELARLGIAVTGCDPTRAMLVEAGKHRELLGRTLLADARTLPFADDSFGGVCACASLLHLSEHDAGLALSELLRVLKPRGVLFTSMQEGPDSSL